MKLVKEIQSIEDVSLKSDLWIFGYGSLMWKQNFHFHEKKPALLHGFHRDFCVKSFSYRGTKNNPGLVLGLNQGGYCHGIAFKLSKEKLLQELPKIWAREINTDIYIPSIVEITLAESDENIEALAFICNPLGAKYIDLTEEQKISYILSANGKYGSCYDYFINTVECLASLNVEDQLLSSLNDKISNHKITSPT